MNSEASVSTPAHCRGCGYALRGLAERGVCPECGGKFDLAVPKSWTRHPRLRRMWRAARWPAAVLLLLLMATGAGVGWLYWGWRQEQPAIQWVEEQARSLQVRQIGPKWVKQLAGRWGWMLERAERACPIVDDSVEARELPRRLRWLRDVHITGPGVTEEWMADLGQNRELQQVHFSSMPGLHYGWRDGLSDRELERMHGPSGIAPAMLKRLGRQGKLKALHINGFNAPDSDGGLEALAQFPELRVLNLRQTRITSAGVQHLRHVPKLEELWLGREAGDDAMPVVARFTSLKVLSLAGTRITARGIGHLYGLANLEILTIDDSGDDAMIDAIAKMPALKVIHVVGHRPVPLDAHSNEPTHPSVVQRLREALPAVQVDEWWGFP